MCGLGALVRPEEPMPREIEPLLDPIQMLLAAGAVRTVAVPWVATRCETPGKLRTLPRGIPSPAEPCVIITLRGALPGVTGGLPTTIVWRPPVGGCGVAKRFGGLIVRGIVAQVFQPPGCQAQPKLGTKTQVP